MQKYYELTAEELFYMGNLMQAKYIDYAYFTALNEIGENFSLISKESEASLVKKGLLQEDFSGNIEADPDFLSVLMPVFFGEFESTIDVCSLKPESRVDINKLHFYDGTMTFVKCESGNLSFKSLDKLEIIDIINDIVNQNVSKTSSETAPDEFTAENTDALISVKNIKLPEKANVFVYIISGGVAFREKTVGTMTCIPKEELRSEITEIVLGGSENGLL